MKYFISFIICLTAVAAQGQIVINEILPSGTVELKNLGETTVDVSSYWLCQFPNYQQISSSNIIAGSAILAPGAILAVDDMETLSGADGEMGLYIASGFGSSENIIDYVEWGSSGHMRSIVAIGAGIWNIEDATPSIPAGFSLAYDGEGDQSSDFTLSTPTIGSENTAVCNVEGGELSIQDGITDMSICVDGNPDFIVPTSSGASGSLSAWVVTDPDNNIVALPETFPIDFDEAGVGTCLLWRISFEEGLTGVTVGSNTADIQGCFDLSNPFTIYREAAHGGIVALADESTTYTGEVGDIVLDVIHSNDAPNLEYWYVITDESENILEFVNASTTSTLDLSGAPAGECHIYGWSSMGEIPPTTGDNIITLTDGDCESVSTNFITVIRQELNCDVVGGTINLTGGSTETVICVDGSPDPLSVDIDGDLGTFSAWIITDTEMNILALPQGGPFDLDGAGVGTCLIWHLSYETGLIGAVVGGNTSELEGCFDLSNSITVNREAADGGMVTLANGSTEYTGTAGDIVVEVVHTTSAPNLGYWYIITDSEESILEFVNVSSTSTLDLSGAPAGECHIYGWSSDGAVTPVTGDDISSLSDGDCESLSENFITVVREEDGECDVNGGSITLEDGSTETVICIDGNPDPITISVAEDFGTFAAWVITDLEANILALPEEGPIDLDGAGVGTCLIWYLRFDSGLMGAEVGMNTANLEGCFDLSNPITVYREAADGGMVTLANGSTEYTGTAGDIVVEVVHTTSAPNLGYWYVITDSGEGILEFVSASTTSTLDLSGAPAGECHIYGWSSDGAVTPVAGESISTLTDGDCESVSENYITIIREEPSVCEVEGGSISLSNEFTETTICIDGNPDPLDVSLNGAQGSLTAWVITDTDLNILALPEGGPFDLDGAGVGTCLIWHLSFEEGLLGVTVGMNAANLEGCFDLSNPITVNREAADGGMVTLANGSTEYTGTAGDIVVEVVHTTSAPNLGYWYIITNSEESILEFVNASTASTLDLSGAPAGECHIYGWSSDGAVSPEAGNDISTLADGDCESISNNYITIIREESQSECTTEVVSSTISGWQMTGLVWNPGDMTAVQPLSTDYSVTPVSGEEAGQIIDGIYIDRRFFAGLDYDFHADFAGPGYEANTNWADLGTYISALPSSNTMALFGLSGTGEEEVIAFRWIGFLDADEDGAYSNGVDTYLGDLDMDGFALPEDASGRLYVAFADRLGQYGNNLGSLQFEYCNGQINGSAQTETANRSNDREGDTINEEDLQAMIARNSATGEPLDLSIYPNPSTGLVQAQGDLPILRYEVMTIEGRQVHIQGANRAHVIQIDLSTEENGVYLIQFFFEDGSSSVQRMTLNR